MMLARYDALFKINNNFQILVLGTPEGYPAQDPDISIKVDSKFGLMTHSTLEPFPKGSRLPRLHPPPPAEHGPSPAGRAQDPPHPSHPHPCKRSETM